MSMELKSYFKDDLVLYGAEIGEAYAKDWSETLPQNPMAVLRPRSTEDVALMLQKATELSQPIVTQGGRTGLAGGATPKQGEYALSTERLNHILDIDPIGKTITVQSGVTLQQIQEAAAEHDLLFPLDLGARGTATAGGITATNAGGNQVIQYGVTRQLILGLTAVLPDGQIMAQDNKLLKNNAGFDLKQLMIGTEGTLGVVTEITFRLFPRRDITKTAFCAAKDFASVASLLAYAGKYLPGLSSFEVLWRDYMDEILHVTGKPDLFDTPSPFYILLEVEAAEDTEHFEERLMMAVTDGIVGDVLLAVNETQQQNFWSYRDSIAELITDMATAINFDIGIPITKMADFTDAIGKELRESFPGIRLVTFGHIGDGNLHMSASTGRQDDCMKIEDLVFQRATDIGGTITAEHGIGVLKKHWLSACRTDVEITMMRRLKAMLDPANILNPGRII